MASSACRIGILATAVFAAVATAACGRSSANKPPAAAPTSAGIENDDAAAGLLEHHR